MLTVVDVERLVKDKKKLPCEAFFVDTNIIIDYKDPFGRSSFDFSLARRNATITEAIDKLKSAGVRPHSTITTAQEYYKHIQVGFYKLYVSKDIEESLGTAFDPEDFKTKRDSDVDFMAQWDLQMTQFKKTFSRNFPLLDLPANVHGLIDGFKGSSADFGDHALWHCALSAGIPCVFSNDSDFLSFYDLKYLMTTSRKVLDRAKDKGVEIV